MQQNDDKKMLVARRTSIKSSVTRFKKYLKKISDSTLTEEITIELDTRLNAITSLLSEYNIVQTEIESLEPNDVDRHEVERSNFEDKYFSLVALAKTKLAESAAQKPTAAPLISQPSTSTSGVSISNPLINVKLPDIKLPEFNGSYDKWTQFHETFDSLINKNAMLTNVQRFFYLQGALTGEAAQIIFSLNATDENYKIAWDLLRERYQNKKAIVHSHVRGIFELSNIAKESHVFLRKFLDDFQKHFRSLKSLGENVDEWNTILIFLLNSKLDSSTRKEWEISSKFKDSPKIDDYIKFVTQRCQLLESLDTNTNFSNRNIQSNKKFNDSRSYSHISTSNPLCPLCDQTHFIYSCKAFLDIPVEKRLAEIKRFRLCSNCLRPRHSNLDCKSQYSCRFCQKRHHSLLHLNQNVGNTNKNQNYIQVTCKKSQDLDYNQESKPETSISHSSNATENLCTHAMASQISYHSYTILSTAIIIVFDRNDKPIRCRALLDSGSQSNFITKKLSNTLGLNCTSINMPISGISQNLINISKRTSIKAQSLRTNYKFELPFLIIDKITGLTPQQRISLTSIKIPENILLADPNFYIPSDIDMLLGAGIFFELLSNDQIKLGKNLPILHKTKLGWIISGPLPIHHSSSLNSCFLSTNDIMQNQLQKFWQIEENYASQKILTKEEAECESHFSETFLRDITGRFTVNLPLKENYRQLGDSQEMAIFRFHAIERKLNKNDQLKTQYSDFLSQYQSLGHMTKINPDNQNEYPIYYLPHHSVEKPDSTTTKLRVVFDGSAKTTSGLSLNDVLKIGPTIQNDLFTIILRFRQHNVVLIGDISMMYRQVNINPMQRSLQRIVWRDHPNQELSHFELNTVTYGTASASFLSTRCLKQIALENRLTFPVESNIISNDFYVDDVLTGTDTVKNLISIRKNLVNILESAGFQLRKFNSNEPTVLADLRSTNSIKNLINESQSAKTLGISWDSASDCFIYDSQISLNSSNPVTKRTILSTISQIFDPLGLLGPIIIQAKILLQHLWLANLNWDDPIPTNLYKSWTNFCNQLLKIKILKIPRHVILKNPISLQIHGFCDSSIHAYGSCVYVRSTNSNGDTQVRLLCAKSRVAPLKAISLPRLELSGALLLSKLVKKVVKSLNLNFESIYYWTDSTIVLAWLSAEPRTWTTFVCNRISEIQNLSDIHNWNHISSKINPADIISRGINPTDLENFSLWWHGPYFLSEPASNWPQNCHISNYSRSPSDLEEFNKKGTCLIASDQNNIFERFSSYSKLIRVMAYCKRFAKGRRFKQMFKIISLNITPSEWYHSEKCLVKLIQAQCFADDFKSLASTNSVRFNSCLKSLNPYLDIDGIIRVGGRLEHANISLNAKHPILIPKKHPFTVLLIRHFHELNFHSGCQATLSFIRRRFWPLNGREAVRNVLRQCIPCFRADPPILSNQMGNLPAPRVTPSRIFSNSGLDYAGPFLLKDGKYRNRKILKCYVCIFVCLSTKAVHIELASELTTEAFVAAFKRFVSRRGMCINLYSDNGSNFIGAHNEFKEIYNILSSKQMQNYFNNSQMQWHFIPARSAHFGGLWEAAVKSLKYHLKRILSTDPYTFEEFITILTQVEASLNSRPLVPLSSDPNDLEAITPGHFIIGQPLNAAPQLNFEDTPVNHLTRFQHLQRLIQIFWTRWKNDYLHNLHQRNKWRFKKETQELNGSLVLLRDEKTLPQQWILGRITSVHPGTDNIVRVVSVLTKTGIVKRSITKISVLPVN